MSKWWEGKAGVEGPERPRGRLPCNEAGKAGRSPALWAPLKMLVFLVRPTGGQ